MRMRIVKIGEWVMGQWDACIRNMEHNRRMGHGLGKVTSQ